MPLTPEDVSNKRFTPVRLREGYDMGEVDQFLDEVEAELARLIKDNDDLREQLSQAHSGAPAPVAAPVSSEPAAEAPAVEEPVAEEPAAEESVAQESVAQEPGDEPAAEEPAAEEPVVEEPAPVAEPTPVAEPVAAAAPQEIRVTTVAEASSAATRLLELATHSADQLVAEARAEAEKVLGTARTEADAHHAEMRTKADKLEADARNRAQMLDSETAERRTQLFGDLEKEKTRLSSEVDSLRSFEREYRSRLHSYFTEQLAALENVTGDPETDGSSDRASGADAGSSDGAQPKRLKSLLGEDE